MPREVMYYEEPGPGRKECVCGVYVRERDTECPGCGHIFPRPEGMPPPASAYGDPSANPRGVLFVLTPAGACPARLKGTTIEQVAEWIDDLKRHFTNNNQT